MTDVNDTYLAALMKIREGFKTIIESDKPEASKLLGNLYKVMPVLDRQVAAMARLKKVEAPASAKK